MLDPNSSIPKLKGISGPLTGAEVFILSQGGKTRKATLDQLVDYFTFDAPGTQYVQIGQKGNANGVATLDGNAKVPKSQLPSFNASEVNAIAEDERGVPNGVAQLDENGLVPVEQLPPIEIPTHARDVAAIPEEEKGQPDGVATLDSNGKLTASQLPIITAEGINAVDASEKGQANGIATLGNDGKLSNSQLPTIPTPSAADVGAIPAMAKGSANGVASLDGSGKLPSAQLPAISATDVGAIATSQRGVANGVASLGSDGKVPSAQLPTSTGDGPVWVDLACPFPTAVYGAHTKLQIGKDSKGVVWIKGSIKFTSSFTAGGNIADVPAAYRVVGLVSGDQFYMNSGAIAQIANSATAANPIRVAWPFAEQWISFANNIAQNAIVVIPPQPLGFAVTP